MDTKKPTDTAATVIIGQRVRAGSELEFEAWQEDMNRGSLQVPGIPRRRDQPAHRACSPNGSWCTASTPSPTSRPGSTARTRQDRLAAGQQYFDGPGTQQVLGGGARPTDPLVTVVVTHRVSPENVEDFLAWQDRLRVAEGEFAGFRGTELFRPVEGVQEEWTTLYRYENATDLDKWLMSKERQDLLAEGEKFSDFRSSTIDNSFGSWFAFDEHGNQVPPPSETKSAIAVWVGLYPTVMLLSLALSPLGMPLWLGLLVGNLLSSFIMSFVTMPYYVNPLLKHWLRPPPDMPTARTNWRGIGIVAAVTAFWVAVFYLVTTQL